MKKLTLMLLCLLSTTLLLAQSHKISGEVRDAQTGELLAGVNIREKNTSNGTTSDEYGRFVLSVGSPEATLVFLLFGFETFELPINRQSNLNVALQPKIQGLDEVVVTALGLERSTKDLGYSVQRLDGDVVSEVKSVNFLDNLAGKLAGVTVTQGATGVGSTSKIIIRGESSFSNNNPLFVVDGIPVNNNAIINYNNDDAAGLQGVDFGNGAMEINSEDIASVTVLKGPGAAALYGTRASNGVIVIKTKDGNDRGKLGVDFNTSTFFDQPFRLPKFQNQYGQGNSGNFAYKDGLGGGVNDNISYSWGPELNPNTLIAQYDSPVNLPDGRVVRGGDLAVHGGLPITPTPFLGYKNNLRDFYQTGVTTNNQISIASGFEKGDMRFSLGDLRSKSILPGVNLNRQTVGYKLNIRPTERLKITTGIQYIRSGSDNRPASGYGSENTNYAIVAWGPRSLNIENMKDYWQPGLDGLQQYSFNYTFFDNPYFTLLENRNSFNRDRVMGNLAATWNFTSHLSLTVRSGLDYSNEFRQFRRHFSSNRFRNGAYAEQTVRFRETNSDFMLNYNTKLGQLDLDFSFGGNQMDQFASNVQTQTTALAQPGVFNLSNAATPLEILPYSARKRINSLYGIARLGYKNYLFAELTSRNDWSSALATPLSAANTSFFYPSASVGFVVSNAFRLPSYISFAKVRASVAQLGNDTDPYQTANVFNAGIPYGGQPTLSANATVANAALLPERSTTWETGFDVRFFDDRFRFDATYYDGVTENQILSLPIAVSSGYKQQVVNGGAVRSRGVELVAGITAIRKKNIQWNTQFNFSRNVATVTSLPDNSGRITLAYNRVYDNVNQTVWFQVEEGGRIGNMYGTGYQKTDDGQFILNANGGFIANNTLQLLGNYNPDFILGMANNLRYKNWNLSFLFDWRQGGVLVSRTLALAAVGGQLRETANRPAEGIVAQGVVNTGTPENPVYTPNTVALTAENYYRQYYDRNHEVNNTYDASYLKLREFSLGYTFGKKQPISVALVGRNLFAFDHTPHFDPEQLASQGTRFVSGVEDMSYASTRSIGLKLGIQF